MYDDDVGAWRALARVWLGLAQPDDDDDDDRHSSARLLAETAVLRHDGDASLGREMLGLHRMLRERTEWRVPLLMCCSRPASLVCFLRVLSLVGWC